MTTLTIDFKFPKVKHRYPLLNIEVQSFRIKPKPEPAQWAKENWFLTNIYAVRGRFIPYAWQEWILNLISHWLHIMIVAPVRTGKTMLADIMRGYCIDQYDMGGMIVFPTHDVAKKNFKLRVIPAIEEIPVLRKYWSGKDDDLTIENLMLRNCIWGIASAQNKNELATFGAQFILADEVSKWRKTNFDPYQLVSGRQKDYVSTGVYRRVAVSSPNMVGDLYYVEVYKQGNLIVDPFVQCPQCKGWFTWMDNDIRETAAVGATDHKNPERIRELKEAAVKYECPLCKSEITEEMRIALNEHVVWAAQKIELKKFKQDAEEIGPDGTVVSNRSKFDSVVVHWNRLIDPTYKFWECLASFFESFRSPEKRMAYENEDMARFYTVKSERKSIEYFLSKRGGYMQYGDTACVPDGVLVAECCMDTQDNGFYYRIRGWGRRMETWLIRHDFIECPMEEKAGNKKDVYETVIRELSPPLIKKNGTRVPIMFGLIDRGGHRQDYVDFLCNHIHWLHAYIGLTRFDAKKPLIQKSETGNFYTGQTEMLSTIVEQYLGLDTWHLPDDVTDDYITQLVSQYWVQHEDDHGQIKQEYIRLPKDHYRDCENYGMGVVKLLELEDRMYSDDGIQWVEQQVAKALPPDSAVPTKTELESKVMRHDPFRPHPPQRKTWLSTIHNRRRP